MKLQISFIVLLVSLAPPRLLAQQPEVKFVADTLVVQAEGIELTGSAIPV
jgi:hypothetical protein